jgi:hypothetical protein
MVLNLPRDETHRPVFAIRGALPWGNLLNAAWDLEDLKWYFEQLSKQGFNFVGFHQYDHEPWCAYEWQGALVGGNPEKTSLDPHLGTIRPLSTADFGFGTGDYFDRDPFASRPRLEGQDREEQIRRAQRMLAQSMDYAQERGIKVCLGFELVGDPTNPDVQAQLEAKIAHLLRTYPRLDYVWFFQSESLGLAGSEVDQTSPLGVLIEKDSPAFAYLGDPKRIAEGVRISHFVQLAYSLVRKYRPDLPLGVNGWGGDRWMRFTDFYLGLDKTLPPDVIFGAMDNIDPAIEPEVSKVYGQLSAGRQRWPVPWWNSDGGGTRRDMWAPQCNTQPFVALCQDVLAKKCQGLLAVHWCTRDVEEVAAYQARFAWNPHLTYEEFYDGFAGRCFGQEWGPRMGRVLRDLEALGPRWTGSLGQATELEFSFASAYPAPTPENLRKLAELRAEVSGVREEMLARRRLEGIERIEWLLTTIDWVTRFDSAVLRLNVDSPVEKLLQQAEAAQAAGDAVLAREKAQAAREAMLQSGFREAILTFPHKMSTMSEFGSFARIQVKAYACYLNLWDRVKKILGQVEDDLGGPAVPEGSPPFIVGRQPCSVLAVGQDVPVSAVVMGGARITSCVLRYRNLGAREWKEVPLAPSFRRTYAGTIPSADVTEGTLGLEWFVEARDRSGRVAHWPRGFPATVWSASIL